MVKFDVCEYHLLVLCVKVLLTSSHFGVLSFAIFSNCWVGFGVIVIFGDYARASEASECESFVIEHILINHVHVLNGKKTDVD